ncbi:MAG: hypothetical protein LDLANPLL_01520 [Turneriella sp.]|nr:hypothetical protein [Turneriella sp.]
MLNLPDPKLLSWYEIIAQKISQRYKTLNLERPLLLAISGPQGSGKSTLAENLPEILFKNHKIISDGFSLDDVYLTHAEREKLAREIHPLLVTRGVPGTHDLVLAEKTIQNLKNGSGGIPLFDKGSDDRYPKSSWRGVKSKNEIIIVEGWCVGCPPEEATSLAKAVNALEEVEDADGKWRRYVNEKLRNEYAHFFKQLDYLVWLQPPSFEQVYAWRSLQEQKLKEKNAKASHVMDEHKLTRFISHFERLTRHMLRVMPSLANITVALDEGHAIKNLF